MDAASHRPRLDIAPACLFACVWIALGCAPADTHDPSPVIYENSAPVGTWQAPAEAAPPDNSASAAQPQISGAAGAQPGMPVTNPGPTVSPGAAGSGGTGAAGAAGDAGTGSMNNAGGNQGMAGGSAGGSTQTLLLLSFDVTTVNQGGHYAPRNVGAIWIETAAGAFVKTLEVWAGKRGRYLTRFNGEAGGSRVDAITSATVRQYGAHHATWDLTDAAGNAVPSGDYKVVIEVTDHDGAGKSTEVAFTDTGMPMMLMPSDQQYFTGMQIVVQ